MREHLHLIRRIVICEKCPVFQQYRLQAKTLNKYVFRGQYRITTKSAQM